MKERTDEAAPLTVDLDFVAGPLRMIFDQFRHLTLPCPGAP
jgi:hypothetical protein